jgi:CelD/BcsL family acetyltransferase involved in cellulose biosynthesis
MKASYDYRYEKCSPGLLLLADVVKRFFEAGATRINMLWGVFGYKRRWLTHLETACEMFVFNDTFAAKLLHFMLFRIDIYSRQLALKKLAWRLLYRLQNLNPLRDEEDRV